MLGWVPSVLLWLFTANLVILFLWGVAAPDSFCDQFGLVGEGRQWLPPAPLCRSPQSGHVASVGWGGLVLVVVIVALSIAEVRRRLRRRRFSAEG